MIDDVGRDLYFDLCRQYLVDRDEGHLLHVADLGRRFVALGVPVEDVAELHEETLTRLDSGSARHEWTSAHRPFMELMIAYSMDFQRQVELRIEAERELRELNGELTENVRQLEVYQEVFDALPLGVSVFRQSDRAAPDSLDFVLGNPAAESTRVRVEKELFSTPDPEPEDSVEKGMSFSAACAEAIRRRAPVDVGVSVFEDPAGGDLRLHTRAFPLFDDHVGIYVEDVTEHKKLEEQLHRAQKMEVVGRLAGGVAHDFNNVLTTIFGFAEFAAEQVDENSSVHDDICQILHAAERAAALTRQLLSFSRRQGMPRVIDPNTQVRAVEAMVRSLLEEDVHCSVRYEEDPWHVRMDPGALEQVIINLVINARDALPAGGRISLEAENIKAGHGEDLLDSTIEPGEYVALSVTDNGMGMSEEVQRKVFEPFFTTKVDEKGTGLGLYICADLVKQAGGSIQLVSKVGKGTRFRIILPRVEEEADQLAPSEKRKKVLGSEVILLVEDDEGVRNSVSRALRDCGYEVLSAAGGEEALRIIEAGSTPVDLLLTDIVMPGLDGRELAQGMMSLDPELKVLFMSGYTGESLVQRGSVVVEEEMIQKPFSLESLQRRVRGILDSR